MKLYTVSIITEAAILAENDQDAWEKAYDLERDILLDNESIIDVYEMIGYPEGYDGRELVYGDHLDRTLDELVNTGHAPAHDRAKSVLKSLLKEND